MNERILIEIESETLRRLFAERRVSIDNLRCINGAGKRHLHQLLLQNLAHESADAFVSNR
ncbi:hypothetical protein [Teredinibacter waterburyi]|jgi:hypothetical protein|uniref:hypothetical protein n=1 Tax=Teredinibacter waterburyi TaxID=1500538 RepID=UPI00165F5396|nr:hypothetical protein [Teredinibacter waterburyi]